MMNLDFSILLPFTNLVWEAAEITIKIGVLSFVLALVLAIIVGSLRAANIPKVLKSILSVYVEFFRGTPLMVQLFIFYYGLPSFGMKVDPILASVLTMGLNSGAYLSEVVRAAVLSVDRGQYDAAAVLGYNHIQTTVHIVLPQAFRIAVPTFMNGFSSIVKETSLVSVLPIIELTKLGNQVYAKTYHPFEVYISLAIIYFIMTYTVTFLAKWIERRLSIWID
ncbi:amino acid ABC transporter permease [Peptoclostridium sp. AF21-18]|uniref:amino acid ABC transporter permease n=1 Tax=Peptoclostridium sp. AF21-18 TaxID=2292243 RepID=UPI000E54FFA1|nr:amino acid ABC transporter permease [Peptoclostridium sp. AF21-18]RHQ98912.1 amino acid ABC transporter permease [Peptoclostridium sp. AF21-18]